MTRTIVRCLLVALVLVPVLTSAAVAQTAPPPNPTPTQIGPNADAPDGYPVKLDRAVVQRTILTIFSILMFVFLVFAAWTVQRDLRLSRRRAHAVPGAEKQRPPARAA